MIQKSTSLKYEPSLELFLNTAKQLFFNRGLYPSNHTPYTLNGVKEGGCRSRCSVDARALRFDPSFNARQRDRDRERESDSGTDRQSEMDRGTAKQSDSGTEAGAGGARGAYESP